MHLVEKLSSYFRCVPLRPDPSVSFYPLPFEKYILIYNNSSVQSNNYKYFQIVIDMLNPIMSKNGIKIVHMVDSDQQEYLGTYGIRGLNKYQINYIIKNALCHICTDTYTNELAGTLGTPTVNLVGNRYSDNFYTFWNKNNFPIQGLRFKKPSFLEMEEPSSVNSIMPEKVCNEVLKRVGIDDEIEKSTIFIGENYPNITIDFIPNFALNDQSLNKFDITIRLDKHFDLETLKCSIFTKKSKLVTDKKLENEFIDNCLHAISEIKFYVDLDSPNDIAKYPISKGIPCKIVTKDKKNLDKIRFKFLDYNVDFEEVAVPNAIKNSNTKELTGYTSKVIISRNKKFASYQHEKDDIPLNDVNSVYKTKLFAETIDSWRIIK